MIFVMIIEALWLSRDCKNRFEYGASANVGSFANVIAVIEMHLSLNEAENVSANACRVLIMNIRQCLS